MTNTTENNKLIAEFMGILPFSESGQYEAKDIIMELDMTMNPCVHFNSPMDVLYADDMKFHSSWDWLMPVVERIEKSGFVCHISWGIDTGYYMIEVDSETESKTIESFNNTGSHIECVYNAVIEFIKWYNKNK